MVVSLDQVEKFVTIGILPENIPPVFTTEKLWLPLEGLAQSYSVTTKVVGDFATYSASKRGSQRRLFGIPHPIFIRDQALFFLKNWPDLGKLVEGSVGSVSVPEFTDWQPRIVKLTPHSDLPEIKLKKFSRYKYCLVTDVSRYFPSVYTHSIPWAIHGKTLSKTDHAAFSSAIWGNRLDFVVRQAQSRQTIGIPVGPDTSKVISEIIMAAVDKEFFRLSRNSSVPYLRHVDDIWIGGESIEECEKHLQNIRQSLRLFQLDIAEAKTKIVTTRDALGDSWPYDLVENLKSSLVPYRPKGSISPVSVMNRIVDRAVLENDDGVIRYTLRRLDESKSWDNSWGVLEHFLAQCAVQFPHSFDYVARVIVWRVIRKKPIDRNLWRDIARSTAKQHASVGNDSEVVWALWLLKELNFKIPKEIYSLVMENCAALPNAFLAHCIKKKLITDQNAHKKLWEVVEGEVFSGPFWPLTLELYHLGLENPAWKKDVEAAPAAIRLLHEAKVSIVNWDAFPKVFDEDHQSPDYAIEDYSFDYGDDHYPKGGWFDDDDDDNDYDSDDDIQPPWMPKPSPPPISIPPDFDLDEILGTISQVAGTPSEIDAAIPSSETDVPDAPIDVVPGAEDEKK